MRFVKEFKGVPDGEVYPVDYQPGDECPNELLASAIELGAVDPNGVDEIIPAGGGNTESTETTTAGPETADATEESAPAQVAEQPVSKAASKKK